MLMLQSYQLLTYQIFFQICSELFFHQVCYQISWHPLKINTQHMPFADNKGHLKFKLQMKLCQVLEKIPLKLTICFSKLLPLKHPHASDLKDSLLEAPSLWKNKVAQMKMSERKRRTEKDGVGRSKNSTMLLVCCRSKPKLVSSGSKTHASHFQEFQSSFLRSIKTCV